MGNSISAGEKESGKWKIENNLKNKKNQQLITHISCKLKSDMLRLTYLLCVTQNKSQLCSQYPQIDEEKPHYGHLRSETISWIIWQDTDGEKGGGEVEEGGWRKEAIECVLSCHLSVCQ